MGDTGIPYVGKSWNIVDGCRKRSPGCLHCWAARTASRTLNNPLMRGRFQNLVTVEGDWTGIVRPREDLLYEPTHWVKQQTVFVCSMADLFDDQVPDHFLDKVFAMMELCRHTFLIVTKCAERLARYLLDKPGALSGRRALEIGGASWMLLGYHHRFGRHKMFPWGRHETDWPLGNVYLAVTVEDQARFDERLPHLQRLAEAGWHTLVSYEPMLGPVRWADWLPRPLSTCKACGEEMDQGDLDHRGRHSYCGGETDPAGFTRGIEGIILGCESGVDRRLPQCPTCDGTGWDQRLDRDDPCPRCSGTGYAAWEWARSTRDACQAAGARFYLKQLPEATGRVIAHPELDGRQWLETPWERQ